MTLCKFACRGVSFVESTHVVLFEVRTEANRKTDAILGDPTLQKAHQRIPGGR